MFKVRLEKQVSSRKERIHLEWNIFKLQGQTSVWVLLDHPRSLCSSWGSDGAGDAQVGSVTVNHGLDRTTH